MAGIGQYLKETQGELRHVAWPTRLQTIVYTILVLAISVGVALYLGLFDYIFTTGMTRLVGAAPAVSPIQITQETNIATSSTSTVVPTFGTSTQTQ
ncbi:MAG: preprotein translocase subunit SecE [Candidatus Paceibacterota bacterium]